MSLQSVVADLTRTFRERPAIAVGGLVALFLGAQFVSRRAPDPTGEPDAETPDDAGPADPYAGDSSWLNYGAPPVFAPPYDYGTDPVPPSPIPSPTPTPTPTPTPDPAECGPMPVARNDQGDWQCQAGGWVWIEDTDPIAGGAKKCGPKPAIPQGMAGKGHWHCNQKTGSWVWKPKTAATPPAPAPKPPKPAPTPKPKPKPKPPKPQPTPKCNIAVFELARGTHRSYAVSGTRITGSRAFTVGEPKRWCAGARLTATPVRPARGGGTPIVVAEIREGNQKGRYLAIAAAGVTWRHV